MSLYSHTNNYKLPKCLDSQLPQHIVSRHYNVEIFQERSLVRSVNIHEQPVLGRITMSGKYYIIVTKSKALKLSQGVDIVW